MERYGYVWEKPLLSAMGDTLKEGEKVGNIISFLRTLAGAGK